MQEGPREGKGPEAALWHRTDSVARAATLEKPAGHQPRTPDKIGGEERGVLIILSWLLCGIVGEKHGGRSFAWFPLSQRE